MLNYASLAVDLPEDVLKRKWAGDLSGEETLISALLKRELPPLLRDRLTLEQAMIPVYRRSFIYSRGQALGMIREKVPDFTEADLDALELDRAVEYAYIDGEKRYLSSFLDTLLKVDPAFRVRAGLAAADTNPELDDVIAEMKREGKVTYCIRLKAELKVNDDAFVPKADYRVYLPLPQACAQQSNIVIDAMGRRIAAPDAFQRTICFERSSSENMPFTAEYEYDNTIIYTDPLNDRKPVSHVYPDVPAPCADDLSEQLPHIAFTPLLRSLAAEIMGNETDPIRIAKRFYDYITTRICYSYMRPYFLIERQAEFCALNGKGDCGIQAILFITLCRIAGIPARWQSGLSVGRETAGCHDWAQFYAEPYGWLFADPSYGGSAYRNGAEERREFYFGNLDPFRMVANSRYQTDFDPPKRCDRADPYDNQEGEAEVNGTLLARDCFAAEQRTLKREKR